METEDDFGAGRGRRLVAGSGGIRYDFAGMVMRAQLVNVRIGFRKPGDVFAGKNGGEPALPELVLALDFTFGLRGMGHAGNYSHKI